MINPLEAVIKYLKDDADLAVLVDDRIANKQHFGAKVSPWDTPSKALRLRMDGGTPELDVPIQTIRIEAMCYGETPYDAMEVWFRLVAISRSAGRKVIANLTDGDALIYSFNRLSEGSQVQDPDTDIDAMLGFFQATVAETAIT